MPGPLRSGGQLILVAPGSGEIVLADDSAAAEMLGQGYQPASADDVQAHNLGEQYGAISQQALAQAERVVRGVTLGQVEGLVGSDREIRERAEYSEKEHQYLSGAVDFLPDVAMAYATGGTSALVTGAGRAAAKQAIRGGVRATLGAAARAAPRTALVGEALGSGAVAASQEAFREGRQFLREDPLEDAQNLLFWSGLSGALSGAPAAFRAVRGGQAGKGAKQAARAADEAELLAAREAGELERAAETMPLPEQAGARTRGEPTTSDPETWARYEQAGEEVPPPSLPPPPDSAPGAPGAAAEPPAPGAAAAEAPAAARAPAPPVEQATPLDTYLASFDPAEREAIEDEIEDQILERFEDLGGKTPQPGSKRWQAVEDEIAIARIEQGGGRFERVPEPVPEAAAAPAPEATTAPREVTPGATERAAQQAAEKGVARAERAALRSDAEDVVERVARGESPLREGGGLARDARLARFQPEIIEAATKEMRSDLNELNRLSQGIRERAVKREDVAKNVSDNLGGQQARARELALAGQKLAGSIKADAAALAGAMGKKKPQYFSGSARELVTSLLEHTRAISQLSDGADIFNGLDDFKRVVDNVKVALEQGSKRSPDPLQYQQLIPRVEEFAHQIRAALEDTSVFGRAGEMQAAYNRTYHEKWFPAKQVFEDSVFRVTGRDYQAFSTLDAWESKVTSLLQQAGSGERRHVVDMLDALREMAEQRAKYGTASKAETGRIVDLVDKLHRTFGLADETTAAARRMQDVGTVASGVAGVLGGVFGGVPGALLGGGLAKGASEFATGRFRNAFSNLRGATDTVVERSVDDWIATSRARAGTPGASVRMPRLSPEDEQLLEVARRRGTTLGFAQFLGADDNPQSAFRAKREALMDDRKFAAAFAEEFGELASEHPQTYLMAAGKAAEVRQFLLARLPSSVAVSMRNPSGFPPSNEAIEDWSVYYNAATDPRGLIRRSLARGDIRPQEIETLRTLYPRRYEQLQTTILKKIVTASQSGEELDDQFLMRMNLLFDLDGAGSPAFSQRAASVAQNYQDPAMQPPASNKPFAPDAGSRISPSNVALTGPTYGTVN